MDIREVVKKGRFDLHLHTTASDGMLPPAKMVEMAAAKGLTVIAITDHDTMAGIPEALKAGEKWSVEVIPGIELSTKDRGINIDILGYGMDKPENLERKLAQLRKFRENRSLLIVERFCDLGMEISMAEVRKHANGEVIARPHIARAVVGKGYADTVQEVFDSYLGDGKPCAVDKMVLSTEEGIELIREAGGVSVLAHPGLIGDRELVEELLSLPFDGLEVWHREHSMEDIKAFMKLARKHNKLLTGGSDFHDHSHRIGDFGYVKT